MSLAARCGGECCLLALACWSTPYAWFHVRPELLDVLLNEVKAGG
jgi:hypothetical protein